MRISPTKKKGSNGILYRTNVPKLNVDTPTAKANDIEKTIAKIIFEFENAEKNRNFFFAKTYIEKINKQKLSIADKSIKGLLTSHI